ncbi:ATP-binding protein, partial [mine drainage metagenome]
MAPTANGCPIAIEAPSISVPIPKVAEPPRSENLAEGDIYKEGSVDVRIGIMHSPREIDVDMPEGTDRDQLLGDVGRVLEDPAAVLWLTDKRGRRVGVPSARIAYVEVGAASDDRRVGFGAPRE